MLSIIIMTDISNSIINNQTCILILITISISYWLSKLSNFDIHIDIHASISTYSKV